MLKLVDIDQSLQNHPQLLDKMHLKRRRRGLYITPENIEFKIVTDKWGWSSKDGIHFVFRLRNRNLEDANGNMPYIDGEIDITYEVLTSTESLDERVYEANNKRLPQENPSRLKGWYRAYDGDDLEALMKIILPAVTEYVTHWMEEQMSPHHKPQPIKRMSSEQWQKVQEQLKNIGKTG